MSVIKDRLIAVSDRIGELAAGGQLDIEEVTEAARQADPELFAGEIDEWTLEQLQSAWLEGHLAGKEADAQLRP